MSPPPAPPCEGCSPLCPCSTAPAPAAGPAAPASGSTPRGGSPASLPASLLEERSSWAKVPAGPCTCEGLHPAKTTRCRNARQVSPGWSWARSSGAVAGAGPPALDPCSLTTGGVYTNTPALGTTGRPVGGGAARTATGGKAVALPVPPVEAPPSGSDPVRGRPCAHARSSPRRGGISMRSEALFAANTGGEGALARDRVEAREEAGGMAWGPPP